MWSLEESVVEKKWAYLHATPVCLCAHRPLCLACPPRILCLIKFPSISKVQAGTCGKRPWQSSWLSPHSQSIPYVSIKALIIALWLVVYVAIPPPAAHPLSQQTTLTFFFFFFPFLVPNTLPNTVPGIEHQNCISQKYRKPCPKRNDFRGLPRPTSISTLNLPPPLKS